MSEEFKKFWQGNCSFQVTETFPSLIAASKQVLPSSAAHFVVDPKKVSFAFNTIKEVTNAANTNDSLREDLSRDSSKGERKESDLVKKK